MLIKFWNFQYVYNVNWKSKKFALIILSLALNHSSSHRGGFETSLGRSHARQALLEQSGFTISYAQKDADRMENIILPDQIAPSRAD